jgi:hypothetical protein
MISNQCVIRQRSNIISIQQNLSTSMKENSPKSEYSLKQNFFDPSKSSPPNEFMIKLHMRMNKFYIDKKDDSLDIE